MDGTTGSSSSSAPPAPPAPAPPRPAASTLSRVGGGDGDGEDGGVNASSSSGGGAPAAASAASAASSSAAAAASDPEASASDDEAQAEGQAAQRPHQHPKRMRSAAAAAAAASAAVAEAVAARAPIRNTRNDPNMVSVIEAAQHRVFGKLGLSEVHFEEHKSFKQRTHSNPLSKKYLGPVEVPAAGWFADGSKPLAVDVGCAAGKFSLLMATGDALPPFQDCNHLGLEIREKLVERANGWAQGKGLAGRTHYVVANANVALRDLVRGYQGPVRLVAVQFPDPHFKRKHHKRRVVNAAFVEMVADVLEDGGYFFVQSDVEEAAAHMRDNIDLSPHFERDGEYTPRDPVLIRERVASCEGEEYWTKDGRRALGGEAAAERDYGDWRVGANPMGAPTEREVQNTVLGLPVYRALFRRRSRVAREGA